MHVMQSLAALSRPFGSVSRRSSPKWLRTSTPDEGGTAGTGAARLDETGFHASVQLRATRRQARLCEVWRQCCRLKGVKPLAANLGLLSHR